MRTSLLLLAGVLTVGSGPVPAGDGPRAGAQALPEKLAPFFRPPASLANDFGAYRSPLKFADGTPVKSAADWQKRRGEILKTWHEAMGTWPHWPNGNNIGPSPFRRTSVGGSACSRPWVWCPRPW